MAKICQIDDNDTKLKLIETLCKASSHFNSALILFLNRIKLKEQAWYLSFAIDRKTSHNEVIEK